jgi:hypothetical protein
VSQQGQIAMPELSRNAKGSDVPERGDDQDNKDCQAAQIHI